MLVSVGAAAEFAASVPWPQLGAGGLLGVAVAFILSGRLVPNRVLKDTQEQRDKWESAWRLSQDTVGELAQQVTALVEVGRTTEAMMRSIVAANDRPEKDPT